MSVGVVGKDTAFKELDEEETKRYLSMIEGEERRAPPASDDEPRPLNEDERRDDSPTDPVPVVAMDTE